MRILALLHKRSTESPVNVVDSLTNENSVIIQPCFIGKNVRLVNTVVGPHVSIGEGTTIENSVINNAIIQSNSQIKNTVAENSMIGNHVIVNGKTTELSLGDYTTLQA